MLSKEELTINVAQSCGVSAEISEFFFEVFINRLSNKLKPGDLLHFHNFGYFHKRNCRIQIEKSSDSPIPKSYLIQLVLFSPDLKIKGDLSEVHFLKIANLKTLWVDDKDFQKSLDSGDFSPYNERNQLIKSFATKAEVIISSLRKDFDVDLAEDLIIPTTFNLNFLSKSGQKSSTSVKSRSNNVESETNEMFTKKSENSTLEIEKEIQAKQKDAGENTVVTEEGLPWNYGTKFLEIENSENSNFEVTSTEHDVDEKFVSENAVNNFKKEQSTRLKDFEPVSSHRSATKNDKMQIDESLKYNANQSDAEDSEESSTLNRFTEVKSRTESYRQKGKSKNNVFAKYSSSKYSDQKAFTARRNFLPLVAILSFIIIAAVIVYVYFIKDSGIPEPINIMISDIRPPDNTTLIERDYDIAVSYPYPKLENRIEMSGFSNNLFSNNEATPEIKKVTNQTVPVVPKTEKIVESSEKQKNEIRSEETIVINQEPVVESEKDINRIFFHKNFYVVYVGSFRSEESANREADKYYDLGYNAVVETIETRNGDKIYKLNIGDFTSVEFALQFQEKFIK